MLCTNGPVRSLVEPALVPEHRRGHGSLYGGLNQGRMDAGRLCRTLAGLPLPKTADDRLVLAVDVSPWPRPRPDAATATARSFCPSGDRGEAKHQKTPGRPYSIVAALETGRTSRTAVLEIGTGPRRIPKSSRLESPAVAGLPARTRGPGPFHEAVSGFHEAVSVAGAEWGAGECGGGASGRVRRDISVGVTRR